MISTDVCNDVAVRPPGHTTDVSVYRVLVVEDSRLDARFIEAILDGDFGCRFETQFTEDLDGALEVLSTQQVDVVLLDLGLPDSDGLETLAKVRSFSSEIAIVVLSGEDNDSLALAAVRGGAQDYLVKGQTSAGIISRSLRYAVERRRISQELATVRAAVRSAKDAIGIFDLDGMASHLNPAFTELFGHSVHSLRTASYAALFSEPSRAERIRRTTVDTGAWDGEATMVRRDGTTFPAVLQTNVVVDDTDHTMGILIICRDNTLQKAMEQERMQRERLHGVLEMAGAACHELNQPLQAISGYVELLLMKTEDGTSTHRQLTEVYGQIERMATVTRKLNHITKYRTREYLEGKHIVDIDQSV